MQIHLNHAPWAHLIIDEAFSPEEWSQIIEFVNQLTPSDVPRGDSVYPCAFDGRPDWEWGGRIYDIMHRFNMAIFDAHHADLTQTRAVDRERLISRLEFRFTGGVYQYPRHVDLETKQMSNVLYVGPGGDWPGMGTLLFENQNSHAYTDIEFEPNRVLSFVSHRDVTWHSFGNPHPVMRKTVNMILGYADDWK